MSGTYQYGWVDKALHWFLALNIGATLFFSYGMSSLPEAHRALEYGDHGLSVTTIAILMTLRLIWRASKGFPALPQAMKSWEKSAAKFVHYAFYLVIFTQICIGLLLASTTSPDFIANLYNINYTRLALVPADLHDTLLSAHKTCYWIIISLIAVHVLAALKHHFVEKDDVLTRMVPFLKPRK